LSIKRRAGWWAVRNVYRKSELTKRDGSCYYGSTVKTEMLNRAQNYYGFYFWFSALCVPGRAFV